MCNLHLCGTLAGEKWGEDTQELQDAHSFAACEGLVAIPRLAVCCCLWRRKKNHCFFSCTFWAGKCQGLNVWNTLKQGHLFADFVFPTLRHYYWSRYVRILRIQNASICCVCFRSVLDLRHRIPSRCRDVDLDFGARSGLSRGAIYESSGGARLRRGSDLKLIRVVFLLNFQYNIFLYSKLLDTSGIPYIMMYIHLKDSHGALRNCRWSNALLFHCNCMNRWKTCMGSINETQPSSDSMFQCFYGVGWFVLSWGSIIFGSQTTVLKLLSPWPFRPWRQLPHDWWEQDRRAWRWSGGDLFLVSCSLKPKFRIGWAD